MPCPACKTEVTETQFRCPACNYGLAPAPEPQPYKGKPRYLGERCDGKVVEPYDAKLSRLYRCDRCRSYGAKVRRIATTGKGLTRMMDWKVHEFIVASCLYCGLIQQFDPSIVDQEARGWTLADFFFDL